MNNSSNRPRLLIVSNLYPLPTEPARGMFNKQQFDLLSNEFDVTVMVPVAWPQWLKQRRRFLDANTGGLVYFPQLYTPKVGRALYGIWMFFSLFGAWLALTKATRFELCLGSWAYPDAFSGYWLAKCLGIPFVMKVHGSDLNEYLAYPARKAQISYVAKRSQGVLCVSLALADKLASIGVNRELIRVVYNGVDSSKFFAVDEVPTTQTLLFVGNLKESKGIVDLLDAFLQIHSSQPGVRLVIAGAGPATKTLRSMIIAAGIEEKVDLLGAVGHEQIPSLIQGATLLVLPSYNEGVPNVVLEAMSCGVPVVATRVGGIPEVVNEGLCGVLVDAGDVPQLSGAILMALSTPWDRSSIKSHASKFSWSENIQATTGLLNEALMTPDKR